MSSHPVESFEDARHPFDDRLSPDLVLRAKQRASCRFWHPLDIVAPILKRLPELHPDRIRRCPTFRVRSPSKEQAGVFAHVILYGFDLVDQRLLSLHLHPDTRRAKAGRASTRFQLTLNVNDLGQAWVHDPFRDVMIEVKAVGPDAQYCENMTLEIHRMLQKFRREKRRSRERCPSLVEARQHFHGMIMDLIGKARKKHDPRRMLARFLGGQMQANRRRQVVELAKIREDSTIDLTSGLPANEIDPVVLVPDTFDETVVPEGDDQPARTTVKPKAARTARRPKEDSKSSIQARSIDDIAAQRPEWDD